LATPPREYHTVSSYRDLNLAPTNRDYYSVQSSSISAYEPRSPMTPDLGSSISDIGSLSFTTGSTSFRTTANDLAHGDSNRKLLRKSNNPKLYDPEIEIQQRKDFETKQWLDLPIAQKLLHILKQFNMVIHSNFTSIGSSIKGSKRLRAGGSLRLTLRLIRYVIRETEVQSIHLEVIRSINKRDMDSEREIEKFSELWNVTGDLEEKEDFITRLLYILAILWDTFEKNVSLDNLEQSQQVFQCIQELFKSRKRILETNLLNEEKKSVLKASNFFEKIEKCTPPQYKELLKDRVWINIYKKYLIPAIRKTDAEEAQFFNQLLKIRQNIYARLNMQMEQREQSHFEFERLQLNQLEQKIKQIRTIEHQRSLDQRSKYDELDVIGSRLWKRTIQNVADQRGPWGKCVDESTSKWKLDKIQNSRHMRLRLKRDYSNVDHSGAAQHLDKLRSQQKNQEIEQSNTTDTAAKNQLLQFKGEIGSFYIPKLAIVKDDQYENKAEEEEEVEKKITLDEDELQFAQEETVYKLDYCEIITPMQAFSGKIELTTKRLMWFADKENKCITFGANEETEKLSKKPKDKIWKISSIQELHLRRYRLRSSAIEIFMTDQSSVFLNFNSKDRNVMYKNILRLKPPNLIFAHQIASPADNLARSNITKLWVKGQISNFDYLMLLNSYAGRTYNDLSQYPVFPWIIQDYTSEKLDLDNPKTYRNLSLPIGALVESKHEALKMRYEANLAPDIPAFHYGSHYSSAGIVLYFLVRMEPYTTYFRILQGGKFDLPDRMFDSVAQTFDNLLHSNDFKELIPEFYYNGNFLKMQNGLDLGTKQNGRKLGDVILPPWAKNVDEFIRINREVLESEYVSQNLHNWIDLIFGYKQQGPEAEKALNVFYHLTYEGNVDIEAIEEEHMKRAIIAQIENFGQTPCQLFTKPHPRRESRRTVPLSLSITPDASSMDVSTSHVELIRDEVEPLADLQVQVNKQITTNKLPIVYIKALQNSTNSNPRLCLVSQDGLIYTGKITTSINGVLFPTVQSIQTIMSDPSFLSASNCRSIGFPVHIGSKLINRKNVINSKSLDLGQLESDSYAYYLNNQCFAIPTIVNKEQELPVFSCLHWDYSVRLSKPFAANPSSNVKISLCSQIALRRHKDKVTCCAICERDEVLVSGSRDTTVIVWDIRDIQRPIQTHILYGHDDAVICVAVNNDLDMVLSGSKDGTCIVHSLRMGNYIRTIRHPKGNPPSLVSIANVEQPFTIAGKINGNLIPFSKGYTSTCVGHIVMYSPVDCTIYLFNINGELIAQRDMNKQLLYAMTIWDCSYLIVGGECGTIEIMRLQDLKLVKTYDLKETHSKSKIRSLYVTTEGSCLFVGLEDGRLLVLYQDLLPASKQLV
jgi:WD40 repeat protein